MTGRSPSLRGATRPPKLNERRRKATKQFQLWRSEKESWIASSQVLLAKMVWTVPDGISVPDWWC
jgi:hypothetical protein